jgi:hypothetical protein
MPVDVETVIEIDRPRDQVAADGPFPMETSYTWTETAAGATRMG